MEDEKCAVDESVDFIDFESMPSKKRRKFENDLKILRLKVRNRLAQERINFYDRLMIKKKELNALTHDLGQQLVDLGFALDDKSKRWHKDLDDEMWDCALKYKEKFAEMEEDGANCACLTTAAKWFKDEDGGDVETKRDREDEKLSIDGKENEGVPDETACTDDDDDAEKRKREKALMRALGHDLE